MVALDGHLARRAKNRISFKSEAWIASGVSCAGARIDPYQQENVE
jgi:hypothetical protein